MRGRAFRPGSHTGVWIDSHCHLDAPEFAADRSEVRTRAAALDVGLCIIPAVCAAQWPHSITVARTHNDAFALGLHPLYLPLYLPHYLSLADSTATASPVSAPTVLPVATAYGAGKGTQYGVTGAVSADAFYAQHIQNTHDALSTALQDLAVTKAHDLVAVGEIGLDHFARPSDDAAQLAAWRAAQEAVFAAQLRIAQAKQLPVILHSRHAVDRCLYHLRREHSHGGIAHAFNGSMVQAKALLDLGFKIGIGGAITYSRAHRLHELSRALPLSALVLETDAPDMPPSWLYQTAASRAAGKKQGRNSPEQIPRIAQSLAALRGLYEQPPAQLMQVLQNNVETALPKVALHLTERG